MTALHSTTQARLVTEKNIVARHALLSFFALAIAITWLLAMHAILFALFHVWPPWLAVARAVALIPFTLIVQQNGTFTSPSLCTSLSMHWISRRGLCFFSDRSSAMISTKDSPPLASPL